MMPWLIHWSRNGDNGINEVINQDSFSVGKVYIQTKRYVESAGNIGDFFGALKHKTAFYDYIWFHSISNTDSQLSRNGHGVN